MDKRKRIIKNIIEVLMAFQIFIAIIFIIRNINIVPQYGDTSEFISLAQTMNLDAYRPFVFPVFLRVCMKVAEKLSLNYVGIVYIIQNIVSLLASFAITKVLMYVLDRKQERREYILDSMFLWSVPFNIHFNMSILADSLAISFTILFIASILIYCKKPKIRYAICTALTMFIVSNIRSEKVYFCVLTLLAVGVTEMIIKIIQRRKLKDNKKTNNEFKKTVIGLLTVIIITTPLCIVVKNIFQTETEGREQPSISSMIYERVVADNLPEYYNQIPEDIRKDISKEEAEQSAAHPNNYKTPYTKLKNMDGNTNRVNQLIKTIFKLDYSNLIIEICNDYAKNIFPTIYHLFDNEQLTIDWTITRMQGDSKLYTNIYLLYYFMMYVIMNTIILVKLLYRKYEFSIKYIKNLSPFIFYMLTSASFFALLSSQNFHVRYAMPVYIIEIAITIALLKSKEVKFDKN